MGSLISLIIILLLSMLITRIATEVLVHTGLSKESAKFQARSAFTGVGFTTSESESIVQHPVRRRIVLSLMLIGNVGVISAVASLMLTFMSEQSGKLADYWRILIILGSVVSLWLLSKSRRVERFIVRWVNKALEKYSGLEIRDFVELLQLTEDYDIKMIKVSSGNWSENKKLNELDLRQEGLNLIAIKRENGEYVGTPHGETKILTGDNLIIYGRIKAIRNFEKRRADYMAKLEHKKAIKEQDKELKKQEEVDAS